MPVYDKIRSALPLLVLPAGSESPDLILFRLRDRTPDDLGEHSHTWLGYRGYLSQVLLNLLTNVERYAYPDGAGGRVEISIGADDERAVRCYLIGVRDFGHGIAPEHLPKVFDPFFTTGRGSGGTGLGLAIVHNIVTSALKGTIAVESSLGQGTRFMLTVPQTIPDEIRTL